MSESTHIEPFEIESSVKTDNTINIAGEETNDNIIFQEDSSENKNNKTNKGGSDSELTCILNIIVSTIGAGSYSLPYVMYQGGIIVSLLLLIFVSLASYYSLDLLRSFVVDTKFFSFALMTETILGPKWLKTYAFCSFTLYTAIEVGYLRSIYIYTKGMINFKSHFAIFFYFVISAIIEIIVCINGTKIANLRYLSIIIISCFSLMIVSLIIVSVAANIFGKVKEKKFTIDNLFFPRIDPPTSLNKMFNMSLYIMIYNFCYSYHGTFPTILGNLKGVTQSTTKRVHFISFTCVFLAYFLITIFGYILTDDVPNELFQDNDDLFQGIWATLRNPFRFILIFFLLFLLPIRFIVLRDNYITLIGKKKMTPKKENIIIIIFTIICNILGFGVTKFEEGLKELQIKNMLQAFGGMFGVIISFCLPVVNYVSINGKRKLKAIIGYVILGLFVWIGIFSTGHSFYYIFSGKQKE
jgi:amino acid permease